MMFAICIESSHQRGMGHFYRALNIVEFLEQTGEESIVFINQDKVSLQILEQKKIPYIVADYSDVSSNWEKKAIEKLGIDVWLLDKFQTGLELAEHVKNENIILTAIDDCGAGAKYVDLHFCSMIYRNLRGKKIYTGKEYLILNQEIEKYRRKREKLGKILITLGGSDTYGVTIKALKILKKSGWRADVAIGPNFKQKDMLFREISCDCKVYQSVPSLIELFSNYDLAVTGGGVTCFEANASGLPCIIIANELHEVEIAKYIETYGGALFAGYYQNIDENCFDLDKLQIEKMSIAALREFRLDGMQKIYQIIKDYRERKNE